jgi:hypothetical protein
MKAYLLYLSICISTIATSQTRNLQTPESSISFHPVTLAKTECISEEQRVDISREIEMNKKEIQHKNPDIFRYRATTHPLFILPFRPKDGFEDYGYYSLFNQVDHDPVFNGNLLDYNCGARTYDLSSYNHRGTDYVIWPYPWKKMEENVMEVVAAADGIIITKRDGNYDRNCENNGNNSWNGIILEHADGSKTYYWHFKSGTLTSKGVGDSVVAGEFLANAGSSGSSDIPHVHFEVYDASGSRIDPYSGPCNSLNTESWWIDQPDYYVPEILTLSTHNTDAFDVECGTVEDPYEELNFVPGETVRFRIFYRDIENGANTYITVTKPNGSILYDYVFTSEWPTYVAAWAQWNFPIDATSMDGVYTVSVSFGGNSYQTNFGVNTNLGVEDIHTSELSIYPNPTSEVLNIELNGKIEKAMIHDILGRKVFEISPMEEKVQIDINNLKTGVYFISVSSEGKKAVRKIVKK